MSTIMERKKDGFTVQDICTVLGTGVIIHAMYTEGMFRRPFPIETRFILTIPYFLYLGVQATGEQHYQREKCEEAYHAKTEVKEFQNLELQRIKRGWDPVVNYIARRNLVDECAVLTGWQEMRRNREAAESTKEE